MHLKLTEKDKHTIKRGGVIVAAILVVFMSIDFFENWGNIRRDLKEQKSRLESVTSGVSGKPGSKEAAVLSLVPKPVIPQAEKVQGPLFREKFYGQLKKCGIKAKSVIILPAAKRRKSSGAKLLRIQCQGQCELKQVFDLLACLNENPCFVGVEDIQLVTDSKDRNKVDMKLTVSTFVK